MQSSTLAWLVRNDQLGISSRRMHTSLLFLDSDILYSSI
jgi:hypothetical protein